MTQKVTPPPPQKALVDESKSFVYPICSFTIYTNHLNYVTILFCNVDYKIWQGNQHAQISGQ